MGGKTILTTTDRDWDITHQKMIHWMIQQVIQEGFIFNHDDSDWLVMTNCFVMLITNKIAWLNIELMGNLTIYHGIIHLGFLFVFLFCMFNRVTIQYVLSLRGVWSQRCYSSCYKETIYCSRLKSKGDRFLFCFLVRCCGICYNNL